MANGTLQADAASAALSAAACACRLYVRMSMYMCLSGAGEGCVGVYCVRALKEGTMQCQSP